MSAKAKKPRAMSKRAVKEPFLSKDVAHIDYKDVAQLRRFVSDKGKIRSRAVTGLTVRQQRMVSVAIKNAREMALLPYAGQGRSR